MCEQNKMFSKEPCDLTTVCVFMSLSVHCLSCESKFLYICLSLSTQETICNLECLFLFAEIVDRVALGEWPYLRPAVNTQTHSEELGLLMQRCWAEEPAERPEFSHIKVFLRKQNRSCSHF